MKSTTPGNIWERLKAASPARLATGRGIGGGVENTIDLDSVLAHSKSLAVLPFTDQSVKHRLSHYCEGIAEELLNSLADVEGLKVIPRTASFHFGDGWRDPVLTGSRLGCDFLVTGGMKESTHGLRVEVRLLETRDGQEVYSAVFEPRVEELIAARQEITGTLTKVLGMPAPEPFPPETAVDPRAYDFYLRGLCYFARHTTQDVVYARQMLKQAIEIEPEYDRAWAGVAYTHGIEYMYFNASNVNLAEVRRTSKKALKLAPGFAQSHVASGIAHCMKREYGAAEKEFSAAIRLKPGNFNPWYFFGRAKVHEGDLERALKLFDCASRVRAEDYQSVLLQAQLYISLGNKEKALEVTGKGLRRVRAALDRNPQDTRALNMGAFALLRQGFDVEAAEWMVRSLQHAPMDSIIQYNGACFFALAGEQERALDCLENCLVKVGNINREWLEHDSDMDNIRDHPRFTEIIRTFPS
ncbi:MAG: tetratricopeptide repeat protein [Lysobacterales bacterium]|jgi:adenylate cyclase